MAGTSLEQFRAKHGQQAYNTLIKAVEDSGRKSPVPDNRSLSGMASRMIAKSQENLAKTPTRISRVRGTSDVPLNDAGLRQADEVGRGIAQKGGLDAVMTSPLQRARNTGVAIAKYTGAPLHVTESLMPWHLGMFEGEPVDDVKHFIAKLALNHPDEKAPGKGIVSTRDGESFNDFKSRMLGGFMAPLMEAHAQDPSSKIGLVTHLRDLLAVKSWVAKGARKDLQFDHHDVNYEAKTAPEEKPTSIYRLHPDKDKWNFDDVDISAKPEEPLGPGIYLIRHGETDWNSPKQEG